MHLASGVPETGKEGLDGKIHSKLIQQLLEKYIQKFYSQDFHKKII